MKRRSFIVNQEGSAVPLILFFVTIFSCGALYTLFFIEIALPTFSSYIPASDAKTFILMCIYAIPLFIIVVGVIALLLAGLKRDWTYYGGGGV